MNDACILSKLDWVLEPVFSPRRLVLYNRSFLYSSYSCRGNILRLTWQDHLNKNTSSFFKCFFFLLFLSFLLSSLFFLLTYSGVNRITCQTLFVTVNLSLGDNLIVALATIMFFFSDTAFFPPSSLLYRARPLTFHCYPPCSHLEFLTSLATT